MKSEDYVTVLLLWDTVYYVFLAVLFYYFFVFSENTNYQIWIKQ